MVKEEKTMMPGSTGGLIRYFDTEEKGIKLTPQSVVFISVGFSMIVLVLKFVG